MARVLKTATIWLGGLALTAAVSFTYLTHRGVITSDLHPIPTCQGPALTRDVEVLVRPVLGASFDLDANNDALESLLGDRSDRALDAKVALMAYYLGEHAGEELIESVLAQHEKATPLVQQYMSCRPPLPSEWRIGTLRSSRTKYDIYLEELAKRRLTTR